MIPYIGPENATIGRSCATTATPRRGSARTTTRRASNTPGPYDQWPSGMGFEYFYGFMGGETDQWTPYLFRDHTQIFPWIGKPGYNLTTDMADEAIAHMRELNAAAPDKPFFVYYVPGGSHSPHQPTQEWIDKFKGKFDMGWNAMREQIFANQKRLGVIPANDRTDRLGRTACRSGTRCRPTKRSCSPGRRRCSPPTRPIPITRSAASSRRSRIMGKLDNTLIIYIGGDNGTSPEGTLLGTPNQYTAYNGFLDVPVEEQLKFYDAWGSAATYPHMAVAWSWAFDTPFKWTKQVASHFGGTRQGMAISWPARIKDAGGIRTQFHHIIDIVPTILEAAGIQAPEAVDGIKQKPIEGVSMVYTFDKANANAPSTRTTQYFEMVGNRGIYHDGWYANTTPPVAPWVLNAPMPDVKRLQVGALQPHRGLLPGQRSRGENAGRSSRKCRRCSCEEAKKYNVFPLDNSQFQRAITPRPSADRGADRVHLLGRDAGHPDRQRAEHSQPVVHHHRRGRGPRGRRRRDDRHRGRLVWRIRPVPAQGQAGVHLQPAHACCMPRWAGEQPLTAGKHTIVFDFTYDGPGIAKGGTGVLKVDGKDVATLKIRNTIPFLMPADETFDVGIDTRTGVNDQDYQVPFRFNGKIDKLTFKLGPTQLTEMTRRRCRSRPPTRTTRRRRRLASMRL